MKLNFWQILGVALLVIGGVWWIYTHNKPAEEPVKPQVAPTTTTAPVTPPK